MQRTPIRTAIPFFLFVSSLAINLGIYPEPVAAQDRSTSLQETLNWVKNQLDHYAVVTSKREDYQETYSSRVFSTDGCRMQIENNYKKIHFSDRKTYTGHQILDFRLNDLDPGSIKTGKLPPSMKGFTLEISTIDKKDSVTADSVKYNGEPEIYVLARVTMVFGSRGKDIAERVGEAFVQAITHCKK